MNINEKDIEHIEFTMKIGDPDAFDLAWQEDDGWIWLRGKREALIAHGLVADGSFPDGIGETGGKRGDKQRRRLYSTLDGFEVLVEMLGRDVRGDYVVTVHKDRNRKEDAQRDQQWLAWSNARRAARKDKSFRAWLNRMIAEAQTFQDDEGELA